jgi:glycosyltransferase involved in cell wall biosynthesis
MKNQTPKPLKFFILSAKGGGTGSALRALYIAQALRKRGHTVDFVKPIPTLPFWLDMALSKPYYLLRSLFFHSDAALAVKPYPTVIPALWWQRVRGAQIVIDVDDLDYAYSRGWFRKFHQWLQKPWPAWADWVSYHNPKLREPILDFFRVPPEKLIQVEQGVDRDIFNLNPVLPEDLPETAKTLKTEKGPLLVFTAHLNNACDLEPVLKSFQSVFKSLPAARLLVAGGGPDEGRFKKIARDLGLSSRVYFTGMLTPRQVAACLKISDLVLTYYGPAAANQHRASMKLREALACGAKVAATRVGEAVRWPRHLFLSAPHPAAYAQTILRALKEKKNPGGSRALVQRWDWTRSVENLEKELSAP